MATLNNGKTIYYKIDDCIRRKGLSQKQVAKAINMSPQNFYDTMNGLKEGNIRYKNLIIIANFLNIDLGIRI